MRLSSVKITCLIPIFWIFSICIVGCGKDDKASQSDFEPIKPAATVNIDSPEDDATVRDPGEPDPKGEAVRKKSLAALTKGGFTVSPGLPTAGHRRGVEGKLRPAREIALRLMALDALFTWTSAPGAAVTTDRLKAYKVSGEALTAGEFETAKPTSTPATGALQITKQDAANESESTLELAPPDGAVVLFDGSNFDAWKPFSWNWINPKNNQNEIQWKIVDDEAMEIGLKFNGKRRKQMLTSKQKFGSYRLHLEFQLPEDGGKGNSGIFFGPLYELQILDSSKKESAGITDCGAIYQVRVPDSNAALAPGQWQTVDLEYKAARINEKGYVTEPGAARVTVRLNGKLIHDNFKLSLRRNKYAAFPEEPTSSIVLQDHDSPVKFRNIWVVESKR